MLCCLCFCLCVCLVLVCVFCYVGGLVVWLYVLCVRVRGCVYDRCCVMCAVVCLVCCCILFMCYRFVCVFGLLLVFVFVYGVIGCACCCFVCCCLLAFKNTWGKNTMLIGNLSLRMFACVLLLLL